MKPQRITITIQDNPVPTAETGDVTITVSGPDAGDLDPDTLLESPAYCAAVGMLRWVGAAAGHTTLVSMPGGSPQ